MSFSCGAPELEGLGFKKQGKGRRYVPVRYNPLSSSCERNVSSRLAVFVLGFREERDLDAFDSRRFSRSYSGSCGAVDCSGAAIELLIDTDSDFPKSHMREDCRVIVSGYRAFFDTLGLYCYA